MEIIEIRGEAKPLNGPVNVLLDVGGRVGDTAIAKHVKSALGGNCI